MGEIKKIPLPRQFYDTDSEALAEGLGSRVVNMFIDDLNAYSKMPGYLLWDSLVSSTIAIDGLFYSRVYDIVIAVHRGKIYKIIEAGIMTDITGDGLSLNARVSFTEGIDGDGTAHIMMANGDHIVTYTNSGTATKMSTRDLAAGGDGVVPGEGAYAGVTSISEIDGFVLTNETGTNNWYFSDPDDCRLWAPAKDIYRAITDPDELLQIKVQNRYIYLFGPKTLEIWYPDGQSPFSRLDHGFQNIGLGADFSISQISNEFYFIDDLDNIVKLVGTTKTLLSRPIADTMESMSYLGDAVGYIISIDRRAIYVLNFPYSNVSLGLDLASGMWTEIGEWDEAKDGFNAFAGQSYCHAVKWRNHLIASKNSAEIYFLDKDYYDNNGTQQVSVLQTAHINHGAYVKKRNIRYTFKVVRGQGATSDGVPHFTLRYNDDNAGWGNWQTIPLGGVNDKVLIIDLKMQGTYTTRQIEIRHGANAPFRLVEIEEEFEVGDH